MTQTMASMKLIVTLLVAHIVASASAVSYSRPFWSQTSYGAKTYLNATSAVSDLNVFTNLTVEAIYVSNTSMRLRVYPTSLKAGQEAPYVVPDVVLPGNTAPASATTAATGTVYNLGQHIPAGGGKVLEVVPNSDDDPTAYLTLENLVFNRQLVSFTTSFRGTTDKLYGYGEHDYHYFLNTEDNVTLSLWNTDNGTPWKNPMYGVHPIVFHSDPTNNRHFGVFWANSHAQNIHIEGDAITYTAVGGIIDLYLIFDTTPMGVVQQYHALVGPSAVPPYWALGTHQCRWGYTNLSVVEAVVAGYEAAGIPLEVMWNDIDYMDQFRVFTTDPTRYPQAALKAFVEGLHAKNMRYIQITDPGVAQATDYSVYTSGVAAGVYVNTSTDGKPLINAVWPGWTVFPDFTADKAAQWWAQQIAQYRALVPIDGMWLDMNELGTFCAGQCDVAVGTPWSVDWKTVDWSRFTVDICMPNNCTVVNSSLNYPPENPLFNGYQLYNKTLDMTGVTSLGRYYETKAFYGLMEERASYEALLAQTGERPFLLSRASYAGSGRYTAHWTGDNTATWGPKEGGLYDSVQGVLAANLWGIPMVGADIGGFGGTTSEELVVRWYQLGVFYTFTRNHHDLQGPGQEPYVFSELAQSAIRDAIFTRYRLLPYLFTYLMLANQNQGPVLRHLSLQFPTDSNTYADLMQFMVGDALLVSPVYEQATSDYMARGVYFPAGAWYHLERTTLLGLPTDKGITVIFGFNSTLYGIVPVFVRGGNVIPFHPTPAMTVTATKASGIGLKVFFDRNESSIGQVQIATDAPLESQNVTVVNFLGVGTLRTGSLVTMSATAPKLNPTLTTRVPVYVRFPICDELTPNATINVTIDGVDVTESSLSNFTCSGFDVLLPLGQDGSTVFHLQWTTSGFAPTEAPADAPTSSNTGAIVGGVLGGAAGAVVIAVAVYFLKFRHVANDYNEVPMRQEV
ncbi:glycoside hydrolase, putative [Bodo saltans]|uniref:Maltase n=1 Tax=Bodo saltans TaxID=75058 RepID=A0A0S4JFD6_BODSA|nr:glycoside hydrolase, putative [Bodo saltans]|eukprot:CUG90124.1 glycoside hydrolase, putative [Bodo saltans]